MKRALALAGATVILLTACGAGEDTDVAAYNDAVQVGPFEDWDQEALDSMGESACEDIADGGAESFAAIIDALEDEGLSDDEAVRAASAFVVRFCPGD